MLRRVGVNKHEGNLLSVQTSRSAERRARGRCEGREHDYMEDKEREWEDGKRSVTIKEGKTEKR